MNDMKDLNLVIGLGKTGLSCVKYCLKNKLPVAVTDSNPRPSEDKTLKTLAPNIQTAFGQISKDLIEEASRLIISPGVSLREPVIKQAIVDGKAYVGDVELFLQHATAPIIAVTGSNAKSTVVTLVGEMAKEAGIKVAVGGNIGLPVLDLLAKSDVELYILELSSFQLETTFSLRAKAASILNISEDHMDRYNNLSEYITAKQKIYNGCEVAVFNRTDKNTFPQNDVTKQITFGLDKSSENNFSLIEKESKIFLAYGKNILVDAAELSLSGRHDLANALAACALAKAANIPQESMIAALKKFKGLPHRCQLVCELHGVHWYNDSKGTNVGATVAAIEGLGEGKNTILIAGGRGKGADFSPLISPINKHVREVILFGEDAEIIENTLKNAGNVNRVANLEEAVTLAAQLSQASDIVLLSPACSSFDMFNNFEHRGNEFIKLVNEL